MKTRVSLKYFMSYCLGSFFDYNLLKSPFKINFFEIFGNCKAFDTVLTYFRTIKWQESPKTSLT